MKTSYCIYGASGHGKVIIEILEALALTVKEMYDDDPKKISLLDYTVTSDKQILEQTGLTWLIGIGNNVIRKKIAKSNLLSYGIAIDPTARVSKRAEIGKGTVVMPGATINSSTLIGEQVIINTNSSIDHDCILENYVHVSPNATLCGGLKIGEGAHIGAGAVIIPGITVGKWVTIGAGTIVVKDVPDNVTIVGNPGKIIKIAKENE